ncbi:hypothetical protein M2267_002817 [Ensifer sp. KUDG1]|jgi:hypothetical protein|uniref:hypothetical protein n=1 Tax=unclassified Ensifer TaxID=2633371 RepID=UPI0005BB5668|nr:MULTISPECIES: hypothetical protein [unclassified Ensifer]KQX29131.1 hypothetical protein ASD01_20765 [Ensifer sp. Root423]MBD9542731.1 hypothetical protein [Ensifer sp. ENS04]MBD9649819.1 hypothetical protein [Ensifer sp. ENS09]OWZ89935.1 hypothetical protein B9J07_30585 [Sinorhizobium sp. LM21]
MTIYFKAGISDETALGMIERCFSDANDYDGYLDIFADYTEKTVSWSKGRSVEEFKDQITEALRAAWEASPFWQVYERREERDDAGTNEIRRAAIALTRTYGGVVVITLSLLGRRSSANDLELVFVCFQEDAQRRNFRVRYDGKFIPSLNA